MKLRLLGAALIATLILTLSRAEPGGQEIIVALKDGQSIDALNKSNGTRTVKHISNTGVYLIATGAAGDDDRVLKNLKADINVDAAEKNGPTNLHSGAEVPPSPPAVQQTASLLDGRTRTTFYGTSVLRSYVDQPALAITRVDDVRNMSTGAATRIAYIDTGVDFQHPALAPWLDPGIDLVFDRTASELDGLSQQMASLLDQQMASLLDQRFLFLLNQVMASLLDSGNATGVFPSALGHGTLVAGILHVVAPAARIVPIKAFDAYGNTTMYTIVQAVYRAREMKVDVLNLSFSINSDSDALRRAIGDAQAGGVTVVASAGNDASDARDYYPAAYPRVIGVASTDLQDRITSFSNYGKSVSLMAPGAFVVSTVPGGRYAAAWGTSFSAPIVSGVVALMASRPGPHQRNSDDILKAADNVDNLNPGFKTLLGRGRVNARKALLER